MTRGWTIPACRGMMYNPSGVQGPQPLYCLPAVTPAVRLAGPLRAGAGASSWPPGLLSGLALFSSSRPFGAAFLPPCTPRFAGGILRTPPAPLDRGAFLVAGNVPPFGRDGGSRPRPLGASLPPPAACGPLPLPTLGGLGAARPARLRRSGTCGGWSPPAAAQVCAPAGLASRQPLRGGTSPQSKAKPLRGAPAARPCFAPPPRRLRRRCSGPPRPHEVGAVGRCGPPARAAALRPASPARPPPTAAGRAARLCLRPRRPA